jgi:class 3 adenylate cyclase/tetratricopeptide (TPR) repeat protein
VLFVDLVGFTAFAEDRDPERVRELLGTYFDRSTDIVRMHGGTVEKFIGDAVMAVWGTPIAHEDDAERAVRAALEIVDAVERLDGSLRARCGIVTGEAAVTIGATNQGMVAGDMVNTAARLQGVAEPGAVLVGEATMRAAAKAVVFEPVGDHALEGKTTPVPAWRAIRVVAALGGEGRTDALEPPFVGRAEELRALKELLHGVGREQRLRLVAVTGPAGIGKSRLVWELEKYVDGVTEDVYWHRGRSPSYGEGITFWALGEMVRRRAGLTEDDDQATSRERIAAVLDEYVPDPAERDRVAPALLSLLGVDPAPSGGREALFPAWRLFFERVAARGTTVLVFEDLQWADAGLLDFVDHLLDWSRGLPILVLALARPELLDRRPDFGAGRRHFTALALEPLPDDAMQVLLAGLVPGVPQSTVEAIVRRAEGIPLYAVETVRALLAEGRIMREGEIYRPTGDLSGIRVPESLRSLIASRLDVLDPVARSLLQDAAVLGQVFDGRALAAVAGRPAEEVDARLRDLMRRELVDVEVDPRSPERGQYKFVQSLIHEVSYGTLGRRERRARHLAAARHFEAMGDEEIAAVLANHYVAAHAASDEGPEADAIAAQARVALVAAATRATALGAHDQAVEYFEQAERVTSDPVERATLLDRATVAARLAATRESEVIARRAVNAWVALGDGAAAARARARLGEIQVDAGHRSMAIETLGQALAEAEAVGALQVQAEALAYLSRVHMLTSRYDESIAFADRALAIAERDRLEEIVAEALINKGSALGGLGRFREGTALLSAAVDLCERHGWAVREIRARNNLTSTLSDEDPARANDLAIAALDRAREVGEGAMYNWLVGTVTWGVQERGGDWDWALEILADSLERAKLPFDRSRNSSIKASLHVMRNEPVDQLIADLRAWAADETEPDFRAGYLFPEGDLAFVSGDYSAAFEAFREVAGFQTQAAEVGAPLAARAAAYAGRPDWVRDMIDRFRTFRLTGAHSGAILAQMEAHAAAAEGRTTDALAGFRNSAAEFRRLGMDFTAACCAVDAAVLLPGEPAARSLAEEARPVLERVRARAWLDILDRSTTTPGEVVPDVQGRESPTAIPS